MVLALLYILNILLRLFVLFELSGFPDFRCPSPGLDTNFYYFLSGLIRIDSPLIKEEPYYYSPLFAWLITFITYIGGDDPYLPRLLSILLGSTVPVGIFLITRELFNSNKLAIISGIIASFYDMFIFYDNQVLKTTYGITLITWAIYFLIKAHTSNRKADLLISGIMSGLSLLIYANGIIFFGGALFYLLMRRGMVSAITFLIPIVIITGSTFLRNYKVANDPVFITAVDGIHFYIGNHRGATGIYKNLEGIRPNPFGHYFDARRLLERQYKRPFKASEVSEYYKEKAMDYIKEDPKGFIRLLLKKALILINHYDVPNNVNISYFKEKTILLRYLTITSGIVLVLGMAGLLLSLKAFNNGINILRLFVILYGISVILFFVTDRYRLPLMIPFLVFSSYPFSFIKEGLKKRLIVGGLIIALTFVVYINLDLRQESFKRAQEAKLRASKELCMIKEDLKNARDDKEKSQHYTRLAELYLRTGGWEEARFYLKSAFKIDPENEYAELTYYKLGIMGIRDVEE